MDKVNGFIYLKAKFYMMILLKGLILMAASLTI